MVRFLQLAGTARGASAIAALALYGCTTDRPSGATFKVDGMPFSSEGQAVDVFRTTLDHDLGQVAPAAERLPGAVLVVLPTRDAIQANATVHNPKLREEGAKFITDMQEAGFTSTAEAVGKARVFDSFRLVRSDLAGHEPAGNAAYKLWLDADPKGQWTWYLARGGGLPRQVALPPAPANNVARFNTFAVAVINTAADLGAGVPRLPYPSPYTGSTTGTGFFIDADGDMLSNSHVVDGCKTLTVALGDGATPAATLVASDRENDVAVIKVPFRSGPFAQFRTGAPIRQGEDVIVYGFPLSGVLSSQGNLSIGIVSALSGLKDDSRQIQISAPVQPGNSGGPVFDGAGSVIGIATGKLNVLNAARLTGDIAQNVNFAIKANIATNFLDAHGIKYGTSPAKPALHVDDVADRARTFTSLIHCDR